MSTIFTALSEEKQKRIINAALRVFSENDFRHASTDDIAAKAKIAKGSLFVYFKNKQALYLFLYEHALNILGDEAGRRLDFSETDYFEILRQSQLVKISLLKEYPFLYRFVIQASMETNPELAEKITEINLQFGAQAFPQLFEKMDASKFKDGTDIQEISKMINWCSEAIWNQGLKTHASTDELFAEVLKLYAFFKKAVYREAYL